MSANGSRKALALHMGAIVLLFALQFVVSDYVHLTTTRVMVLAIFAMGYNVLFGYTGLLSLGHAMFFAAGLYGAGLSAHYLGWSVPAAFGAGIGAGLVASTVVGVVALRTTGVAFMIVTLMFSQVAYLASLYFTTYTRGEEGIALQGSTRNFTAFGYLVDLTNPVVRYNIALALLALTMAIILALVRGATGRTLVAVRENESRTQMLGYNTFVIKLKAMVISGTLAAASGAAYALLFAYIGSTFVSFKYSIDPLLFTLLGGPGTVLGPLIGSFLMFYVEEYARELTTAYLLITGAVLIALVLFFPRGLAGTVRERWWKWLP